jgi:predicted nucleic acid-binding protein
VLIPTREAVVVDTMVVSGILNAVRDPGTAEPYQTTIGDRLVLVSFITVAELRFGAIKAGWGEFRTRSLERSLAKFLVIKPDDLLLTACAELRWAAHQRGHALSQKVHDSDRWIAATALHLDLDLVSDDRVFREFPGLRLVQPGKS